MGRARGLPDSQEDRPNDQPHTQRMGLVRVKVAAFKDLKQKKTLSIYFLAGSFSVSTEFTYFIDIHEAQRKPKSFF